MLRIHTRGKAAIDTTAYGHTWRDTKNFLTHHMRRQARAATLAVARHMLAEIDILKAKAARVARKPPGAS